MTRRQTHGTLLQLSDGAASPTYTTIAQVRNMGVPPLSTAVTELADHDMTDSKEYLPAGLADVGGAPFEVYLDPQNAGHQELYTLAKSRERNDWRIVLPDSAGQWDFEAFVTGFEVGDIDANDGVLEATITLQATAAPVMT